MMSQNTTYTEDEINALPQTDTVFNVPPVVVNDHEWVQEGYFMTDACPSRSVSCYTGGLPIPPGGLLIKDEKGYRIVDEQTRK